ncbi:actin-like ATPase domain-containing protein [Cantharellus anzutake]|uniref:actin-like ATPase domain-containing protein n=1 Tax=Cantharellus anzutake TaxID=1750568 RepID=UPI001904B0A0|nr:actin-like ATPase domain-containing protein [Cantharellus anzutake]KAF8333258.1 actin-like ATPase domain-containing protein [Cantharellus anzutake]
MSVSIDFGTAFSRVAYCSSHVAGGIVEQIPTCLLYDDAGRVLARGLEAKHAIPMPATVICERFKLFLEPSALRDDIVDPRLPKLPSGKKAVDLIIDFLTCLWDYARERITQEIDVVADLNSADVWLTVPATWDTKGCRTMRDAAIQAGLVGAASADDRDWRDRLHIITESEAAAVHCTRLTNFRQLRSSQNFMICDAGDTVDLTVYKIIGSLQNFEIAEMCACSRSNCGSLLDLKFKELVRTLLADHPVHLEPDSLEYFTYAFNETGKLEYLGESNDGDMFYFTCFNVEDPDDPSVGLVNGDLALPGNLLRREVFDPVIEQVLNLIESQTRRVDQRIDALLLVGGFSGSEYLFRRMNETFGSRIKVIARPSDADTATCRGAAQLGLPGHPLVSSIIVPRSYIMGVSLPVEPEDWQRPQAYITENDAGDHICENRLQYFVSKGAILRRGQRVRAKCRKFSSTPRDFLFVAMFYATDSDKIMRYTDELAGEMYTLARWTVDLTNLPNFQQHANNPQPGGFYTDFEIGLELDSAEIRGVILYHGYDYGQVTLDLLV